ncbi:MAG TPA: LysR family transcriptional regulator [Candidatus Ventrousia excrementavium]|uniref:LysR family transcriptional regulator n=1 Tax=Candidatus Ventrousia excrementavium TaxID=2840961 RepID=A0A9D1LM42_9CLOT|nr:LysR family transcriptional regulator [Candidatus Ventrousia excrementavium]
MHFKQVEAFVNVIRHKSFSKAAEAIYLSQPTISAHISSLENELGVCLIVRSTKEVYPSAAGQIFYQYALEMLRLRDRAILEVQSYSTEVRGELDIAASTVPSQYILPELLPSLVEKYPKVFFSVRQYDSGEVVGRIVNMEAEVGMTGTAPDKGACAFEPFMDDQLVLIAPNTPEYQEMAELAPSVLRSLPVIVRESGSGTRREAEEFLLGAGVDPKSLHVVAQMQSTESIKQAVRKGLGVSVISRLAAADFLESGDVLELKLQSTHPQRSFYLVYHKKRPLSPAAEVFVKEVRARFGVAAPQDEQ